MATPIATSLGYLGIAKESSPGVAVAATNWLPVPRARVWLDNLTPATDTGYRRATVSGPFDQYVGPLWSTYTIPDGPAYPDSSLPWWVLGILGDVTSTNVAGSLYSHVGSLLNPAAAQPTSYTLTDFYGITGTNTRQFAGCRVTDVTVKFGADTPMTVGAKLTGFASTLVATPTASETSIPTMAGWRGTATVGGVTNVRIKSGEITFTRATPGQSGAMLNIDGGQAPSQVRVGGLAVSGKATFVAVDDTEYLTYLNNTKPAVVFNFQSGTAGTNGFLQAKFQMSKCNHSTVTANHSGSYMTWDATLTALPNTTDAGATGGYSPIQATFENALAVGTFQ